MRIGVDRNRATGRDLVRAHRKLPLIRAAKGFWQPTPCGSATFDGDQFAGRKIAC
jgi:hypothetical protein